MISFDLDFPTGNYTSLDFTHFQHYSPQIFFTIMGSRNSLQGNSEFSQVEIIELSDEFSSAVSLYNQETSTEPSASQAMMAAQPSHMVDQSVKDDHNISSSSHTSPNNLQNNSEFSLGEESKFSDKYVSAVLSDIEANSTDPWVSQIMKTILLIDKALSLANDDPNVSPSSRTPVRENEKLQVKFPFSFISKENIPHISVVVQNGNAITFTMNSKTTSGSESDPAQPSPSATLENLDSTISREDLALLPTKIFPPLLGWKGIPCETLKLHNLFIDWSLFETIRTSGIKILHILNCTVDDFLSLNFQHMKTLEELNISLPDFDGWIPTPASLKTLKAHCPKSKECSGSPWLGLWAWSSESLEHV
jgi:hypothetical protein